MRKLTEHHKRHVRKRAHGGEAHNRGGARKPKDLPCGVSTHLVFLDHEVLVDDLHGKVFLCIGLLHQSHLASRKRKQVLGHSGGCDHSRLKIRLAYLSKRSTADQLHTSEVLSREFTTLRPHVGCLELRQLLFHSRSLVFRQFLDFRVLLPQSAINSSSVHRSTL